MNPTDLDELERLAAAATPGPWEAIRPRINIRIMAGDRYVLESGPCGVRTEEDGQFIAAARAAVPALIAEVRRLRAQVEGHCDRMAKQSELLSRRAERGAP
jgi:hypothetical protein